MSKLWREIVLRLYYAYHEVQFVLSVARHQFYWGRKMRWFRRLRTHLSRCPACHRLNWFDVHRKCIPF